MNSIFDPTQECASLRRLLEHDYPEEPGRVERIKRSARLLLTAAHRRLAGIAARLRRWEAFWDNWEPSPHLASRWDFTAKLGFILAVILLFLEVGVAFLPHGAVWRVLGGGR
jgi:hypothetical protein